MDGHEESTPNGIRYRTTRRQMTERLAGIESECIRTYYVKIGKQRYPVKQTVAIGLEADRGAFQAQEAYRSCTP